MAALATVDQVGLVLKASLESDDPTAQFWLAAVSGAARLYTGQHISRVVDDVEYHRPSGVIQLRESPVISVSKVEILTDRTTDTWTELASNPYWYPTTRLAQVAFGGSYLPYGATNDSIRITYTHGYDPVPDEVAGAVANAAARMMNTPPGIVSDHVGQRSTNYRADDFFTGFELMVLRGYREARTA